MQYLYIILAVLLLRDVAMANGNLLQNWMPQGDAYQQTGLIDPSVGAPPLFAPQPVTPGTAPIPAGAVTPIPAEEKARLAAEKLGKGERVSWSGYDPSWKLNQAEQDAAQRYNEEVYRSIDQYNEYYEAQKAYTARRNLAAERLAAESTAGNILGGRVSPTGRTARRYGEAPPPEYDPSKTLKPQKVAADQFAYESGAASVAQPRARSGTKPKSDSYGWFRPVTSYDKQGNPIFYGKNDMGAVDTTGNYGSDNPSLRGRAVHTSLEKNLDYDTLQKYGGREAMQTAIFGQGKRFSTELHAEVQDFINKNATNPTYKKKIAEFNKLFAIDPTGMINPISGEPYHTVIPGSAPVMSFSGQAVPGTGATLERTGAGKTAEQTYKRFITEVLNASKSPRSNKLKRFVNEITAKRDPEDRTKVVQKANFADMKRGVASLLIDAVLYENLGIPVLNAEGTGFTYQQAESL